MKKIYKYALGVEDTQMIEMPKGAFILTVQAQGEIPCIWAEVDPTTEKICRSFVTYGTGHPMDDARTSTTSAPTSFGAVRWFSTSTRIGSSTRKARR